MIVYYTLEIIDHFKYIYHDSLYLYMYKRLFFDIVLVIWLVAVVVLYKRFRKEQLQSHQNEQIVAYKSEETEVV